MPGTIKHLPGYTVRSPIAGGTAAAHGTVAFTDKDWKKFEKKANIDGRKQVMATLNLWCRYGPNNLPEKKFKFQDHIKRGDNSVRLEAFKGWQIRIYGVTMDIGGKTIFVVTACDPSKKRDAADRELLEIAGHKAIEIELEIIERLRNEQK